MKKYKKYVDAIHKAMSLEWGVCELITCWMWSWGVLILGTPCFLGKCSQSVRQMSGPWLHPKWVLIAAIPCSLSVNLHIMFVFTMDEAHGWRNCKPKKNPSVFRRHLIFMCIPNKKKRRDVTPIYVHYLCALEMLSIYKYMILLDLKNRC
jgi:hypothetical protein